MEEQVNLQEQSSLNILDSMLKIVQGENEQSKTSHSEATLSLVNKKGQVNENAKQMLVYYINLLKKKFKGDNPSGRISSETSNTIQLYTPHQVSTDSTQMFCEFLVKMLKDEQCQIVQEKALLQEHLPLLLVCPSGSRLEASVDNALNGFQWDESFKVIILNFGTEMSLPEIASKKKVPLKPAYQNIEFIDMAFNKDDKLYECMMNKTAMSKIITFIKSKKKEK